MTSRRSPTLEVFLLGPFRVLVDGRQVEERRWERRRARQLVKLLALQPHAQLGREQIMEWLWPEEDPETAAGNLHRLIHVARRALEPHLKPGAGSSFIRVDGEQVRLHAPGGLWVDAREFTRLATQALSGSDASLFQRALELYEDDLLVEDPYEEWALRPRARLSDLRRELLLGLAAVHESGGGYERSIECLKRLTARDQTDEDAHRRLMLLYARTGRKNQAMAQYRLCSEAVHREFDSEPEPATQELYRQILADEVDRQRRESIELPTATFEQLTFRRGSIHQARFAPDGRTVICGAAWDGSRYGVYEIQPESPEPRAIGPEGASVACVSPSGKVALLAERRLLRGYVRAGKLAVLQPGDTPPRVILEDVQWADFSPDGSDFAVVRDSGGRNRLEFPAGHVLFETGGWISHTRFSPEGDRLAFIHHPVTADDGGEVMTVDPDGRAETLSPGWMSVMGLAWSPDASEVWFTATRRGLNRSLYAVSLAGGGERLLKRATLSPMTLQDVDRGGRVLLTRDSTRLGIMALAPGAAGERDLSWQDWSAARDLSEDGRLLLFTEAGQGGGATYGVFVRGTDGSPARRLGGGSALALSPDGRWALARPTCVSELLVMLPLSGGEPRSVGTLGVTCHPWACWLPDGERVVVLGSEEGRGSRLYLVEVEGGGRPRPISPEGALLTTPHAASADGLCVAALGPDRRVRLFPVEGGEPVDVAGLLEGEVPVRWGADPRTLYVYDRAEVPARVFLVDIGTGEREARAELMPPDPAGVTEVLRVLMTQGGESYAYTYTRDLSDLFLLEGLSGTTPNSL